MIKIKRPMNRKCSNLDILKKLTIECSEICNTDNIVIEKEVEVSKKLFENISKNFFNDQKIINDNIKNMYSDSDDIWHSIIIFCKEIDDMIIVESEGYSYLRYTAYISKKDYLKVRMEQATNEDTYSIIE